MDKIDVFAINLVKRTDRKASILSEFVGKEEFRFTIVPAIEHNIGGIGLWYTICAIVERSVEEDLEYVILCEDDHVFPPCYSCIDLRRGIAAAVEREADVLLGGVSWLTTCIQSFENIYWIEKFSGLQFTIVFKKFYKKILEANFGMGDDADYKISSLSDKIYFIYPFISTQKSFGYSDVTMNNNVEERVEQLFLDASERVIATDKVVSFYKNQLRHIELGEALCSDLGNISISTYIVPSLGSKGENSEIKNQFKGRTMFDVHTVKTKQNIKDSEAYWQCIKEIVCSAIAQDDDVIIVCEDDHTFTKEFSEQNFIRDILLANQLGTGILCGGIDDIDIAIPITKDKVWINEFKSCPFIILFKSVFQKILNQSVSSQMERGNLYREITSNKMAIFPAISFRAKFDEITHELTVPSKRTVDERLKSIYKTAESLGLI